MFLLLFTINKNYILINIVQQNSQSRGREMAVTLAKLVSVITVNPVVIFSSIRL